MQMRHKKPSAAKPWIIRMTGVSAVLALAIALVWLSGCTYLGYIANAVEGEGATVDKAAQYRGLEGKTIAVLVATDEYTLYEHPDAPAAVGRAVSRQIAADIKGVTMMDPKQLADFQKQNLYWHTMPYGDIVKRLKVDRVVYVDLAQFVTHDGGDKTLWRGTIDANVNVIAADAQNPDDLVFSTRTHASFPTDKEVGVLESNDQTIKAGTIGLFAQKVANLFRDHQAPAKEKS